MKRIVTLVLMMLIGAYAAAAQAQTPNPPGSSTAPGSSSSAGNQTSPPPNQAGGQNSTGSSNQGNRQSPTETETATKEFLGFKWGMGVGVMGFGGATAVEKASVTGTEKLVRVEEEGDFRPQVFLEMHAFVIGHKVSCWREYQQKMSTWRETSTVSPSPAKVSSKTGKTICPEWKLDEKPSMPNPPLMGFGPFVALQSSANQAIDAFALGLMMGRRKGPTDTSSVNIGIGLAFDPSVQVLGHGVKEGQPLPAGETAVRFKKEGRFGWALMTSFTF